MTSATHTATFWQAFYEWSTPRLAGEVANNFPMHRKIRGSESVEKIVLLSRFPGELRTRLLAIEQKRLLHQRGVLPPLEKAEAALWEEYYYMRSHPGFPSVNLEAMPLYRRMGLDPAMDYPPEVLALLREFEIDVYDLSTVERPTGAVRRREILKGMKQRYEACVRDDGGGEYHFESPLSGEDALVTALDFGGSSYQLRVDFEIRSPRGERLVRFGFGSLLGGGCMGWDLITKNTLEKSVGEVCWLCEEIRTFVRGAWQGV